MGPFFDAIVSSRGCRSQISCCCEGQGYSQDNGINLTCRDAHFPIHTTSHENKRRRRTDHTSLLLSTAPLTRMSVQESYVPTHPDLFIVEFLPGDFASRLVSLKVCFRLCDLIISVPPSLFTAPLAIRFRRDDHGLVSLR